MAFNETMVNRVRELISEIEKIILEKKMFGGLCFMVDDKMCIGVENERLLVRVNPDRFEEFIGKDGCNPMEFGGKMMKGFLFVGFEVLQNRHELKYWVDVALEYNKIAKPSKKKKAG